MRDDCRRGTDKAVERVVGEQPRLDEFAIVSFACPCLRGSKPQTCEDRRGFQAATNAQLFQHSAEHAYGLIGAASVHLAGLYARVTNRHDRGHRFL